MASRIYLPASTSAPAITPAVGTGWTATATTGFVRVIGSTTKAASALANHASASPSATSPGTCVMRQYIVGPLAAQTISGTLTGVIRGLESNANHNGTVAICVRQVSSTGTHIADLLSVAASDNTAAAPPEFGTTAATRRLQDAAEGTSLALTSRTFSHGDYLVIELGFRKASTSTTTTVTLRFGDSAATDFAHSDGLTTDLNPWVEFSTTLTFPQVSTGTAAGRAGGASQILGAALIAARVVVSWVQLQIPAVSTAAGVSSQGRAGAQSTSAGTAIRTATGTAQGHAGARAQTVAASTSRVAVAASRAGARAQTAGTALQVRVASVQGSSGARAAALATSARGVATQLARAGASSQTVGSAVLAGAGFAQGHAGAQATLRGSSARVSASAARGGVAGQAVGLKRATATGSGRAGGRALTAGIASQIGQAAVLGRAGAGAQLAAAATTRTGAVAAHTGIRSQVSAAAVEAKSGATQGQLGARGQTLGIRAATGAASGRGAARLQTAPVPVRIGPSQGQLGAHAGVLGLIAGARSLQARTAASATCSGLKRIAATAIATTGNRSQAAAIRQATGIVLGRAGCQALVVSIAGRSSGSLSRAGAAARTASTGPQASTGQLTGHAGVQSQSVGLTTGPPVGLVGRAGAASMCTATTTRGAVVRATAGSRATSGAGPTQRTAVPLAGHLGARFTIGVQTSGRGRPGKLVVTTTFEGDLQIATRQRNGIGAAPEREGELVATARRRGGLQTATRVKHKVQAGARTGD